ncbi:amino acid racemase [Bradyrhizobium sp. IC3069]|uniref:aspartate/glutamate racemase family protein n=1 Tax=unclassified Bradyrhizobium TaxID=2631580 RepID=UPI001CD64867|nr:MULTISPECIES: amino acid racemase [unclassified Bradyrhizobium]MCA1363362.1 amino acid racemase [Bradyrhizobium sp. IC4059]MCA1520900.1 amino acid racemase [Bradyrhizobium sp. IC3069]
MKCIGLLGGSSDQATADYYRQLNLLVKQRLGGFNTAELVITSMNFAISEYCVRNEKWDELGEYLANRAKALELAGADFYLCVSNTLHCTAPRFTAATKLPFLHIADPTASAIRNAGLTRVALLGTLPTMSSDFMRGRFESQHGLHVLVPAVNEMRTIDGIIFDELDQGVLTERSKAVFLDIIDGMHTQGAQGIILGCTEIPLLVKQADRPSIPLFDTMALHVQAAVEMALA